MPGHPPRGVLAEVIELQVRSAQLAGTPREAAAPSNTQADSPRRGDILAHASVLLGDLGQDQTADNYGHAALLCLQEAEAARPPRGTPWPRPPDGDIATPPPRPRTGAWGTADHAYERTNWPATKRMQRRFLVTGPVPAGRLRRLSRSRSCFRPDNPAVTVVLPRWPAGHLQALCPAGIRAIRRSIAGCCSGEDSWLQVARAILERGLQVRTGAAIATFCRSSLDGAVEQVAPVLTLEPNMRIATVTGWLPTSTAALRRHGSYPHVRSSVSTGATCSTAPSSESCRR